jgi:hypothetical protein
MNRPTFVITLMLSLIFVLYGVYVFLSINLATKNVEYVVLQEELARLKRENILLLEKILQIKAFTHIQGTALDQGFVPQQVYVLQ